MTGGFRSGGLLILLQSANESTVMYRRPQCQQPLHIIFVIEELTYSTVTEMFVLLVP